MAVGPVTPYREGALRIWRGELLLLTDTIKAAILDNAYTPNVDTHNLWGDISTNEIAAGGGYTAGGSTLGSKTIAESGAFIVFDAADIDYNSATIAGRYKVLYSDGATKYLIAYVDLNFGGSGNVSSTNSDFDLNWNANGILRMNTAPA